MWFRLHPEKNNGRKVGYYFFFLKTFFLEYSEMLRNDIRQTDIKGLIFEDINLF